MLLQLLVCFIIVLPDCRLFQCPVHPLDLPVRPRMMDLRQTMLDAVLLATTIERMMKCVSLSLLVRELNAVVGQHCMDRVRNSIDQSLQKSYGILARGAFVQLGEREL